jgi:hypothetical protein
MTAASRSREPAETNGGGRWRLAALALITPVGPLAIAGVRFVLPYRTTDDTRSVAAAVAAHPGAASAVLWLDLMAVLTLLVGVFVVSSVAVRAAPVLGTVGAVLAVAGFAALSMGPIPVDPAVEGAVRAGLDPAATARVLDAMANHPSAQLATGLFVLGHILGLVLLGAALWKGHAVPVWAALALIASQPLHFVFAVITPNSALDATAWLLTAIGFAAAGLALTHGPKAHPTLLPIPATKPGTH